MVIASDDSMSPVPDALMVMFDEAFISKFLPTVIVVFLSDFILISLASTVNVSLHLRSMSPDFDSIVIFLFLVSMRM